MTQINFFIIQIMIKNNFIVMNYKKMNIFFYKTRRKTL